jgi:hypothetical protein
LSDLARARIVPLRIFHIGNVHGAVQCVREGRWGCLVGDCPEVARAAAGRRARDVGLRWVRARVLNAGQLFFDDGRYLLLYNASDLLLHNSGDLLLYDTCDLLYDTSDLLLNDSGDLLLDSTGDLLLHDSGDFLADDIRDLMFYDTLDLPAHYFTQLLLHRSFHFVPDGMHDFALHGDCQLLLHYVPDFLGYSLLHLPDVRYLIDGLLNQREALVDGIVHAGNGL